ncbi:uncharacterized protein LOC144381417 [Halichoerus grypus]
MLLFKLVLIDYRDPSQNLDKTKLQVQHQVAKGAHILTGDDGQPKNLEGKKEKGFHLCSSGAQCGALHWLQQLRDPGTSDGSPQKKDHQGYSNCKPGKSVRVPLSE